MSRDPGAELWLADILEGVTKANQESQRALKSESQTGWELESKTHHARLTLFSVCMHVSVSSGSSSEPGSEGEPGRTDPEGSGTA